MRFKLYKVLDDEAKTILLEGEVQYSLAKLKSAHGIERDNGKCSSPKSDRLTPNIGISVALPPSSVSLAVRLLPSQNAERFDSAFESI